jgi:hypothetical protein
MPIPDLIDLEDTMKAKGIRNRSALLLDLARNWIKQNA